MHTYPQHWDEDTEFEYPISETDTFRRAEDIVEKAEGWPLMGRATYPAVWHLDGEGHYLCGWNASSACTLIGWADDPEMLDTHLMHSRADGCSHDRWVIVDSRPAGFRSRGPVSEADASAFLALRRYLSTFGIELLDAVVFDDRQHWWSMHELTSGSTEWR